MKKIEIINAESDAYKRENLKVGLAKCTEHEQMIFKKMYSEHDLNVSVNHVVDAMAKSLLDWATTQVYLTVEGR